MPAGVTHSDRRILVVEDEKDLAHLLSEILRALPADVIVAKNGWEAIHHIETGKAFDLVLLDVVLPQMSGLEVLRRLRRISASTKVILSTGYATSLDAKDLTKLEIAGLLGKPYTPGELLAAVRGALSPEADSPPRQAEPGD